jgi:hypothetical protein
MSATPTRMTRQDWQPLRDLGFGDRELLEVGHVVGIFIGETRQKVDLYRSGATMDAITAALYDDGRVADVFALTVTRTRSHQ